MAQVIEHAHEDHEVEPLAELRDRVHVELTQLDLVTEHLGRELSLREVARIGVDADDARGASALHLERVEPGVAADVEHALTGEIRRQRIGEALELRARVVAEEVLRSGLDAVEHEVVKPWIELADAALECRLAHGHHITSRT